MYTVDYFIDKFEKIPEFKWTTGYSGWVGYGDGSKLCAGGHCGFDGTVHTEESLALTDILRPLVSPRLKNHQIIYEINDGNKEYSQPTPKERILAALYDIKKMPNEQEPERSVANPMPKEPEAGKTIHVYHTVKVSETIFDQAKEILSHN